MNKIWLLAGGAVLVLIAGAMQLLSASRTKPPESVFPEFQLVEGTIATTSEARDTTTSSSQARPAPILPSIASGDTIASWDSKGVYAGNTDLIKKAEAEIIRLSGLIGKGEYPDTTLYVAISGQYRLLGNGKQEYDYLVRAIQADGTDGLPWHNLGVLMERLGAYETARIDYEKATLLQPSKAFYQSAYRDFLAAHSGV